ncbi:feline leukemia virus subgroup C receptor-related protein 2-like [Diprion similis]|uniref:feline leukemia virus subgroup C receptor-related protein 2-like n=1 Tax=Diprion similis TaxID=362088 RepID=UPI001EF89E64|nr:feline leukemia virus subgroup C receptor-related protein 2-like [Diprion similis]
MEALQEGNSLDEDDRTDVSLKALNFTLEVKVFRRRWLQLLLLFILNTSNCVHVYQFTIITSIVRRYYKISSLAVELTVVVFLVACTILALPASYLMNRIGLRWTCLITTLLTCLGSWIKVFSVSPDQFIVACIGQLVIAVAHVFVLAFPGPLVAFWFGAKETGLATTIVTLGVFMGYFVSFLTPSILFTNHESIESIGNDLSTVFWTAAVYSSVVTVTLFFLFQEQPDLPPSKARALVLKTHRESNAKVFWNEIKEILSNRGFLIFWNSYGIIASMPGVLTIFISPLYVAHFEDGEKEAGIMVLLFVIMGSIGGMIFSAILDRTKAFRAVPIVISALEVVIDILFATSLVNEIKWITFVSYSFLGYCVMSYVVIGTELCVEMTYPQPESTVAGILFLANPIYGIGMVLLTGRILEFFGDIAAHGCICAYLTLGSLLMIVNRFEFRRYKAGMITADYNSTHVHLQTFVRLAIKDILLFQSRELSVCVQKIYDLSNLYFQRDYGLFIGHGFIIPALYDATSYENVETIGKVLFQGVKVSALMLSKILSRCIVATPSQAAENRKIVILAKPVFFLHLTSERKLRIEYVNTVSGSTGSVTTWSNGAELVTKHDRMLINVRLIKAKLLGTLTKRSIA